MRLSLQDQRGRFSQHGCFLNLLPASTPQLLQTIFSATLPGWESNHPVEVHQIRSQLCRPEVFRRPALQAVASGNSETASPAQTDQQQD